MKTILTNENPCCYELTPVNRRLAKLQKDATGEESVLFQSDWDFPGLARALGWKGSVGRERCKHQSTDGTVTCPDCGMTASEFIGAASDWLDCHVGCVFVGKGEEYFQI